MVDEFIALLGQEAEKFDLSADLISFAEDAEETPFIYDLNDDATRSAFSCHAQDQFDGGNS